MRTPTRKHLAVLLAAAVLAALVVVSGEPEPPPAAAHDTTPAGISECPYQGLYVGTSLGVYQCYRSVNRHYEVRTTVAQSATVPGPGVTCDGNGRCIRRRTVSCTVYGLAARVCDVPVGWSYEGSVDNGPYWHAEIDRVTVGCAAGSHQDSYGFCHRHLRSTPPQTFYDAGCGLWHPHLHAQRSSPVRGGHLNPIPAHSSVDLGSCGTTPADDDTSAYVNHDYDYDYDYDGAWHLPETTVTGQTVDEDAGAADFTITLSAVSTSAVTVDVATSDGTATSGSDYAAVNRAVTIPAGSKRQWCR